MVSDMEMSKNEVIIPTTAEVVTLLTIAKNDRIIDIQNIGELLGMKLGDSLLPKVEGVPAWGYDGLRAFFIEHSIDSSCDIEEALEKLSK